MHSIMRVVANYGSAVAAAMATAASIARSADEINQHALNIANQWRNAGAAVERGYQPANPHPQYVYYCWEWDARFNCWRVAQWNGFTWVIL
jgi:hypothetical protein